MRIFARMGKINPLQMVKQMYPKSSKYIIFPFIFKGTNQASQAWQLFFLNNFMGLAKWVYLNRIKPFEAHGRPEYSIKTPLIFYDSIRLPLPDERERRGDTALALLQGREHFASGARPYLSQMKKGLLICCRYCHS